MGVKFMVKPADLDKEYFVVLTLDYEDLAPAVKIQNIIADKYDLYDENDCPELHVTIDRINKEKVTEAKKIIDTITKEIEEIKIEINNLKCFRHTNNFLILDVKNTPSLTETANKMHNSLEQQNISTIKNYEDWKFHITLISNHFADNPIPKFELDQLCLNLDGVPHEISTTAKAIEIWQPKLDPEEKTIVSSKI